MLPLTLTEQRQGLKESMKGGGATKRASSFIYIIPSTYTVEIFGFINFEELNPTNKKLLGVNKVDYRPHNWL